MSERQRRWLVRGGMVAAVVAISWFVYSIRDRADVLITYGYPGIFLFSILANATVILPAPGLALVFAAGALKSLSPIGIGIAAGLGATLGELSGYAAGYGGSAIVENRQIYERLQALMKRYGPIAITVLAFVPNPFFDVAGAIAGTLKMPVWRFLLFSALGKVPKMILFAYAGAGALAALPWLEQWFSTR